MKATAQKFLFLLPVIFLLISIFFGWQLVKLQKERQLTKTLPQPQPSLPAQSFSSDETQFSSKIEAVSSLPDYQLKVSNRPELDAFLEEIGFWGENSVIDLRSPSQKVTAKALKIELVPQIKDPWWQQVNKDGEVVAAINTQVTDEGVAKISFSVWQEDFANQEKLVGRMDTLLRLGLYGLSPILREQTSQDEKMSGVIKHLGQQYSHYDHLLTISLK